MNHENDQNMKTKVFDNQHLTGCNEICDNGSIKVSSTIFMHT